MDRDDARDWRDCVRRTYDAIAQDYAARLGDELSYKPLDRALLAALLEEAGPGARVADLGCGPGHVAGWLASRGAVAVGIDLSPKMIATGRLAYPAVEFREGDLTALPADEGEFAAAIALYSIIHLPPDQRSRAFEELKRVVQPRGAVLVSFHVGDEVRHVAEWWGHPVDVDGRYLRPDVVEAELEEAGLPVRARLERANYPQEVATRRAYLLAVRPG